MKKSLKFEFDKDAQLISKASDGDFLSSERLYEKFFPIVRGYLANRNGNHSSSQDLAQEVFVRFLKNNVKFRDESAFKAYIFGIAKNVLHEHYRRVQRERAIRQRSHLQLGKINTSSEPEAVLHRQELTDVIERAKSRLSDKEKQALEIAFFSDIPLSEAAKNTGCSEKVLRQRLYSAKKRLRELLRNFPEPL